MVSNVNNGFELGGSAFTGSWLNLLMRRIEAVEGFGNRRFRIPRLCRMQVARYPSVSLLMEALVHLTPGPPDVGTVFSNTRLQIRQGSIYRMI
jgi:hypothetical protein